MTDRIVVDLQVRPQPWSYNDDRKLNPYDKAAIKNEWKTAARYALHQHKVHNPELYKVTNKKSRATGDHHKVNTLVGKWIVTLEIVFPDKRRRDPHNYCSTVLKAVIDGLVVAGAWKDDTPDYVGHREPILVVDPSGRRMPRVILEREVADEIAARPQASVSSSSGGAGSYRSQDDRAGGRTPVGEHQGGEPPDRPGMGEAVDGEAHPDGEGDEDAGPNPSRRYKL
jgi:hypothetical protein